MGEVVLVYLQPCACICMYMCDNQDKSSLRIKPAEKGENPSFTSWLLLYHFALDTVPLGFQPRRRLRRPRSHGSAAHGIPSGFSLLYHFDNGRIRPFFCAHGADAIGCFFVLAKGAGDGRVCGTILGDFCDKIAEAVARVGQMPCDVA